MLKENNMAKIKTMRRLLPTRIPTDQPTNRLTDDRASYCVTMAHQLKNKAESILILESFFIAREGFCYWFSNFKAFISFIISVIFENGKLDGKKGWGKGEKML